MPDRELTYRQALNEALHEEMARDAGVCIFGEDVGRYGGAFRVTQGLFDRFGEKRVRDTPISEEGFTGIAVGAAMTGLRPVVEILYIDFSTLAIDQIVNQAAKQEFISGGQCRVPMVLRTQGGAGNGLAAQHSQSLEAFFYHTPGLKVVMPSTPHDACGLLKAAIRDDQPVIFIEHKLLYMTRGPVPEEEYVIPLGQAEVKKSGTDVSLITYSHMTLKCLEAAAALEADGIRAEVVDLRTLSPLDKETILASARKTGRAIVVHEAVKRGGVGGDIAAMLMEEAYDDLDGPVLRIAGRNTPIPYNLNIEKACVPSVEDIVAGVLRMV